MATVTNKTQKPLTIALRGGKTLRLGPGATARITPKAAESNQIKKAVEAGEIEVVAKDTAQTTGRGGGPGGPGMSHGHASSSTSRRSGDR